MIENERQYRIMVAELEKFVKAFVQAIEDPSDPMIVLVELAALRGQMDHLFQQILVYCRGLEKH